jgi:hypothetical protein
MFTTVVKVSPGRTARTSRSMDRLTQAPLNPLCAQFAGTSSAQLHLSRSRRESASRIEYDPTRLMS